MTDVVAEVDHVYNQCHRHTPYPYFALCVQRAGNEVIPKECCALTHTVPEEDGFALCNSIAAVPRAAYLRFGAILLAHSSTLDSLVQMVKVLRPESEGFHIETFALPGARDGASRAAMLAIAAALEGRPNLMAPLRRFALVIRHDGLWLGRIVTTADGSWKGHETRPFRTSSSLPARLARAIVNLAAEPSQRILNICCGSGSILLEAARIGADTYGIDWNQRMVGMARANAAHFGYTIHLELADARYWHQRGDVVVADLPYNRNCKTTEDNVRSIVSQAITMAPRAIFVADQDICDWICNAGWDSTTVYQVPHPSGFVRFIHEASVVSTK
jgi:predicted RNA methylase